MENRIQGKLILITGASAGIGKACAEKLAASGGSLILAARRLDRLHKIGQKLLEKYGAAIDVFALDVRNRKAVESFSRELKARDMIPDVLINNAGLASGLDPLHSGHFEDWDRMIDTCQ